MSVDAIPLWLVLLLTIGLVLVALQAGIRLGRRRQARGAGKLEVSGAMVGATMGLLAFMLAFTFNSAAGRHDARKKLVIEEANAIETTWLRAGFLADSSRDSMRELLRNYVSVRVKAALGQMDLAQGLHDSEELQGRMWALTVESGRREPGSVALGLFIQSLNHVIDLHVERLTVSVRNRVPGTVWTMLYMLMAIGMFMIGAQIGRDTRHPGTGSRWPSRFLVLLLIADPTVRAGMIRVSQQALLDCKAAGRPMNRHPHDGIDTARG